MTNPKSRAALSGAVMGNEFFGFSSDAFEQFARALCMSVFGPGAIVFGDGPDGGREGIFRGTVPYPFPPTDLWSGYGVIQAKCKAKPEGTDNDQKWAMKLLKDELDLFVSSAKRQPKPEYYIFITNVELSAAGKGWDAGDKVIESYRTKLPTLKGHAIWGASQLRGYIDTYSELRRGFVAYLTPGDVLAALIADIERRRPNATRILTNYLDRWLRVDEASRVQQAGDQTDTKLSLARLFFDLPVSLDQQLTPPEEQPDANGNFPPGVLAELLQVGSRKLDRTTARLSEPGLGTDKHNWPKVFLLLGGPGSGKSTIGQFLAQIHRAALLERCDPTPFLPSTLQHIAEIRYRCEMDGLPWPATPRYPFRVELNRFAKALASEKSDHVDTLAGYLRNLITQNNDLSHLDLLDWLRVYPWLLILDGLDEVPATSNRPAVVAAINDFLAEAAQVGADLFVVASSRPQSYLDEFANSDLTYSYIRPLSRDRSMLYVRRYANARFGPGDPRADDVITTLAQECRNELTSQLMSSPLQATFMVTVTAAHGTPSKSRWQLFHSYYGTIYQRELQKKVEPLDAVLRDYPDLIERLHHDIGFLLQARGETGARQGVAFSLDEFRRLVEDYLTVSGYKGAERDQLVRKIVEIAGERLLLLTSRVPGELTFDVRSLQEYMAAECLITPGKDYDIGPVKERLWVIAPIGYWRNVFLFAADKCFSDTASRGLIDPLRLMCADLNDSKGRLFQLTRVGSELALDILYGAAVTNKPESSRYLARIALGLLSTSPAPDRVSRLAAVYQESIAEVYRDLVGLHIGNTDVERTLTAWCLVVHLMKRGIEWAADLAERSLPAPESSAWVLGHLLLQFQDVPWVVRKLAEVVTHLPPESAIPLCERLGFNLESILVASLSHLSRMARGDAVEFNFKIESDRDTGVTLKVNLINPAEQATRDLFETLAQVSWQHPGWLAISSVARFLNSPNAVTLASILRACADGGCLDSSIGKFPWPLLGCFQAAKGVEALRSLAAAAERGDLGDTDDWLKAERRWSESGVTLADMVYEPPSSLPFDRDIGDRGVVIYSWSVRKLQGDALHHLCETLLSEATRTTSPSVCASMLTLLFFPKYNAQFVLQNSSPETLRKLIEQSNFQLWDYDCPLPNSADRVAGWIEFLDWFGQADPHGRERFRQLRLNSKWPPVLASAFSTDPTRLGLLCLLGRMVSQAWVPDEIPSASLVLQSTADPQVRLAALIVRLAQSSLTEAEAEQLADTAISLLDKPDPLASELVFATVHAHHVRIPALTRFLIRLYDLASASLTRIQAQCAAHLRTTLQRQPSDLHRPNQLAKLQLPVGAPEDDE